jgi:hypothetical protein
MGAGRVRQTIVGRDERRVERFSERDVERVIGGYVMAEGPGALEESGRGIASDGKDEEILDRRRGSFRVELPAPLEPTERVQDLCVQQIWRRRWLFRVEQVLLRGIGERKTQQETHDR